MADFKMGDLVTYRDAERIPTHALVLEVLPEGETLRITRGSATESATVLQEDMIKPATLGAGIVGLHRRLAYSLTQVPKVLEDKDQEVTQAREWAGDLALKVQDIRKWMISLHESGELHRSDLDTFLNEFGMEPYTKRWTGQVTITVSLTVDDARNKDSAEDQAYAWAETLIEDSDNEEISSAGIARMTYNLAEDLT